MKSLQHVWWRGALALSLLAVGIGGGLAMPQAAPAASIDDCAAARVALARAAVPASAPAPRATRLLVLRRRVGAPG